MEGRGFILAILAKKVYPTSLRGENGEHQRYIEERRRRRRMMNPSDIAGEGRRRRRMLNPRDIAGEAEDKEEW